MLKKEAKKIFANPHSMIFKKTGMMNVYKLRGLYVFIICS
jgi:hypothetical protein